MRVLQEGRPARVIARLLTVVFVWSVYLTSFGIAPAAAQGVTRAATTQTVAVVPFENLSGLMPEVLGEEASTAVSVELRDRLLLDVLPKADITLQMRDLGLMPPLGDGELVRLATELEVALLITGQVRQARILRSPEGRHAEVVLAVRLFDRVARCDVNGAVATGRGPSSPDASDEVLVRKALAQVAFQAIEEMKGRPTITGKVLWSRGDSLFLSAGTRDGVREGMKMVAIRAGERIGMARVTETGPTGSDATVIEGSSLRTGDMLRVVYELPSGDRPRAARAIERTGKRFEKVLLAAAVLFGLGSHASRARLLAEGGIAAPSFVASNLANAVELGTCPMQWYSGCTLITWETYSNTQAKRLVGYEIWRNTGEFVDFVYLPISGGENYYIDQPWPAGIWVNEVTLDELGGTGFEAYFVEWVPTVNEDGSLSPTWEEFLDSNADLLGLAYESDLTTYGWVPEGPVPGQSYYYRVKPLIVVQRQLGDGEYAYELTAETEYSSPDSLVVTVLPPFAFDTYLVFSDYEQGVNEYRAVEPNPEIVGNLATFRFYAPVGADEAIIQVTREPNVDFDPETVYSQSISGIPFSWQGMTVEVDLTQVPGTGGMFWWRIGARNRRSSVQPRPWPFSLTNDYGWVWSDRLRFGLTSTSRAALLHQERESLVRSQLRGVRLPHRTTGERVHRAE